MKYKSVRGTKDIFKPESSEWQRIEDKARKIFAVYGYGEIRTPIMEETGLFVKSVGEDTDIVKKEMFSFQDRGERDITLRPEGTAPIVRAYLEHNLDKTEPFQKLYYIGPMFRAERPQAGRLRQFQQIGVEAIGSSSPALDAEVINLAIKLLESFGVVGSHLAINNLGCREDKSKLSAILKDTFTKKPAAGLLCDDCKRRSSTNPLRILDCKNESCRNIVRKTFKEIDFLCPDCVLHFEQTIRFLDLLGVKYAVDPYIVRGLDYYTRTVFEISHDKLGAQNAIGAGGRYDNLISDMGGTATGAFGFALGVDRVIMAINELDGASARPEQGLGLFIATIGEEGYRKAFSILNELRAAGIACDIDYESSSLKSQMRRADKIKAKFVLIIGDDEVRKGEAVLRDMNTKEQINVNIEDIVKTVKGKIL